MPRAEARGFSQPWYAQIRPWRSLLNGRSRFAPTTAPAGTVLHVLRVTEGGHSSRKELATELGCPAELMGDSAKMNMWLHKTVLNKIAEHGGNIPKELLD